jgi:hypothetical protein
MNAITRDWLHELVDGLSDEDLATAGQPLATLPSSSELTIDINPDGHATSRRRALAEAKPPLDAAFFAADFWPEERSAEEVVATIDRWRREGGHV